ncbi:hypothetical protein EGW08_006213 [Elysia chlorotica]|uniref:Serine protease K12H4.7 n=1 Tax=Elysia chlorotica TaxID=188477 RepID=A0A433TWN0_ELYCH|nr:hypothetical protein EGW08_006213 [Elysia chlorotica]
MESLFRLIVLTVVIVCASAYIPRFLRGRPKGGFLGAPALDHLNKEELVAVHNDLPDAQFFIQKLDHFDTQDTRTWKQRFFQSCATKSKVLFVMIGGEGTANPIWNVQGTWIEYAKNYGAVCLQLEHRYYGDSHPTLDTSLENIQYLSSEQALYDLATFIHAKKTEFGAEKVIIFGGSYPGSLAAWFRIKFPYLVDGAVSTSAPLLAQVNFKGYLEVVQNSLDTFKASGGSCNDAITAANVAIQNLLTTQAGRSQLKAMFRLCDDIDVNEKNDIANLFSTLAGNFEGVVQYNKDNRAFEGGAGTNITIDTVCGIMTNKALGDELHRYAQVNSLMLKTYSQNCTEFKYSKMIASLRDVAWSSEAAEGGRQWTYQTCTEFGWYQSSDSEAQPFKHTFPIDFWTQQCQDIFNIKFNSSFIARAVAHTNDGYGARNYTQDRVVFVNGDIDPWHYLGITKSLPQAQAILIPGTAHCANMYPAAEDDPAALVQARKTVGQLIAQWLQ